MKNRKTEFYAWLENNLTIYVEPQYIVDSFEEVFKKYARTNIWFIDSVIILNEYLTIILNNNLFKNSNYNKYVFIEDNIKYYKQFLEQKKQVNHIDEQAQNNKKIIDIFFKNKTYSDIFFRLFLHAKKEANDIETIVKNEILQVKVKGERIRFYCNKEGKIKFGKIHKPKTENLELINIFETNIFEEISDCNKMFAQSQFRYIQEETEQSIKNIKVYYFYSELEKEFHDYLINNYMKENKEHAKTYAYTIIVQGRAFSNFLNTIGVFKNIYNSNHYHNILKEFVLPLKENKSLLTETEYKRNMFYLNKFIDFVELKKHNSDYKKNNYLNYYESKPKYVSYLGHEYFTNDWKQIFIYIANCLYEDYGTKIKNFLSKKGYDVKYDKNKMELVFSENNKKLDSCIDLIMEMFRHCKCDLEILNIGIER